MTQTVRPITVAELPGVVSAGFSFFQEGNLPGGFKPEVFIRTWTQLLLSQRGVFFGSFAGEAFTGGLGAVLTPDPNNGDLIAIECFWYVLPQHRGHGLRLLKAFEQWAKAVGAKRVAMIHLLNLHPDSLKGLYERLGYRAVEINYIKEL